MPTIGWMTWPHYISRFLSIPNKLWKLKRRRYCTWISCGIALKCCETSSVHSSSNIFRFFELSLIIDKDPKEIKKICFWPELFVRFQLVLCYDWKPPPVSEQVFARSLCADLKIILGSPRFSCPILCEFVPSWEYALRNEF